MATYYNLTNTFIEKITSPESGDAVYNDNKVHGLQLRVLSSGTKSFRIFKIVNKNRLVKSIGIFPEIKIELARQKALEIIANLQQLIDEKNNKIENPTFKDIYEYYYNNHALKNNKKTYLLDIEYLHRKYISQWEYYHQPYQLINKRIVNDFLLNNEELKDKARTHNKISSLITTIFNVCTDYGYIEESPITGRLIKRKGLKPRSRILTLQEIELMVQGIMKEPNIYVRLFFLLLMCVSTRLTNTLEMRWESVDLDAGLWILNWGETKNDNEHIIPLTKRAKNILCKLKQIKINDYVFPSLRVSNKPINNITKNWDKIREFANIKDVVLHDFRRTQASMMNKLKFTEFTIMKAIDHQSSMPVTAIYVRPDYDDVLEALEAIQDLMFKDNYFDNL